MQSLSKQLPAAAATHLLLLNMSGKGPGGLRSTRGTGSGPRGHLWAGGSGGDDSGFGHPLAACGSGCRQNSLFCPQRSPLPPSWASSSSKDGADVYPASLGTCPSFYAHREPCCSLSCFCRPPRPFFWCMETCWAQARADACSTDTSRVLHQQPDACWEARGLGTRG